MADILARWSVLLRPSTAPCIFSHLFYSVILAEAKATLSRLTFFNTKVPFVSIKGVAILCHYPGDFYCLCSTFSVLFLLFASPDLAKLKTFLQCLRAFDPDKQLRLLVTATLNGQNFCCRIQKRPIFDVSPKSQTVNWKHGLICLKHKFLTRRAIPSPFNIQKLCAFFPKGN